jgi:hypothetical protein
VRKPRSANEAVRVEFRSTSRRYRHQTTQSLDEFIAEDNAVRVVDAFVNKPDLYILGIARTLKAVRSTRA